MRSTRLLVCSVLAATAIATAAMAVAVPDDLLAVLTLRGKPCGKIASYERKGESDYLVTCSDGHHYRVYVGPGDRVVVEEKKK